MAVAHITNVRQLFIPLNVTLPSRKFVGLRSEMDAVIAKYTDSGNDWTVLRDELNLGTNTNLSLEEIY